ncbi:hypothetical protein B1H18_32840 [Streptomyces tsukubensis]|uniref:Carrier domain-containing protein n=1 Tax=Streptomyces tsukubensis TaxID=83656 RepID=A0A1V3ZZS8_9ACTN|nr:hypothetical protein B1H18_32840 [Streptomyces tsukubensis]
MDTSLLSEHEVGSERPAARKEQALWFLDSLVPGSGVNNLTMAFRAEGSLHQKAVQNALDHLLSRHEVLRAVFRESTGEAGLVRVVLAPRARQVPVVRVESTAPTVEEDLAPFIGAPFEADGNLLLRAVHARRSDGDVFCVVVHHSIFDGLSTMVLLREFLAVYDALMSGKPIPKELSTQVAPWSEPEPTEGSEAFWGSQLKGLVPENLKTGCENRPASDTTLTGDVVRRNLSSEFKDAVRRLQRELRAPEAVILLAAYYVLLAKHGAGPDLTVGAPVSLRDREHTDAIGYHINVLTLRANVDYTLTFREFVGHVRHGFLSAMEHADYPVDELMESVERTDSSWRNVLFRHLFNYAPIGDAQGLVSGGRRVNRLTLENGFSKFDLELFIGSLADSFELRGVFYTDVFARGDVERLLDRYAALLLSFDEDADRPIAEVRAWSAQDSSVIGAVNATACPVEPATVVEAFAERVRRTPQARAVDEDGRTVTYAQLWARATAVRDRLGALGADTGETVATAARRGVSLVAAALGTWLAGCAYLPLDPDHPAQRTNYVLHDSAARLVLVGPGVTVPGGEHTVVRLEDITASEPGTDVVCAPPDREAPAYLIYTSGSTGKPKGTVVGHGSLANLISHFARELSATENDVTLWLTTFSFDISALEVFLPLWTGGTVVVAPDEARTDGRALREVLRRHGPGIVQATPTTWRVVLDQVASELAGWRVLSGGEPLPGGLSRRLAGTGCWLRNVYGPTETTIWSTSGVVDPSLGSVDVGTPIANTKAFVIGAHGDELPVGVRGELCIAGAGVATGYHARPELTGDRFGEHPEYGRFYRTGDAARWLPTGRLEVMGRLDRQIKLRGNRIELAEIESVLLEDRGVRAAAVIVDGEQPQDAVLVAFVVGEPRVADRLWRHARTSLPLSAVPAEYVQVDAFPTTGNDKIDYPALRREASARRRSADRSHASNQHGDETVNGLIALWQELLPVDHADAESNFFASGGHSLMGARLLQRIEAETGARLKLTDLFEHPTPLSLAGRLQQVRGA